MRPARHLKLDVQELIKKGNLDLTTKKNSLLEARSISRLDSIRVWDIFPHCVRG